MTSLQPAEPFRHLRISSAEVLEQVTERSPCPKCHKSRMYFCYNCLVPVDALAGRIPHVRLPVAVEIVKHPGETNGKSTAVHAAVLAPDDVTLRTYPDVGNYDPDETVLVFPGPSAGSVADVSAEFAACGRSVRRALFLDCTWNQCRRLLDSEELRALRCVQLSAHETRFWRYQRGKPRTHLATVEAVYYFMRELHESRHGAGAYRGEYDDLLFFFDHFYRTVLRSKAAGTLWAYRSEDTWQRPSERARRAELRDGRCSPSERARRAEQKDGRSSPSERARRAGQKDGRCSPSERARRAEQKDGRCSPSERARRAELRDGRSSPSERARRAELRDGRSSPSERARRAGQKDGRRAGAQEDSQGGDRGGAEPSDRDSELIS